MADIINNNPGPVREREVVVDDRGRGSNAGWVIAAIVILVLLLLLFGAGSLLRGGAGSTGTGGTSQTTTQGN